MENKNISPLYVDLNEYFTTCDYSNRIFDHPSGFHYSEAVQELQLQYNCSWLVDHLLAFSKQFSFDGLFTWSVDRVLTRYQGQVLTRSNTFSINAKRAGQLPFFESAVEREDFAGDTIVLYQRDKVLFMPCEDKH
jgi:hypothetical protein